MAYRPEDSEAMTPSEVELWSYIDLTGDQRSSALDYWHQRALNQRKTTILGEVSSYLDLILISKAQKLDRAMDLAPGWRNSITDVQKIESLSWRITQLEGWRRDIASYRSATALRNAIRSLSAHEFNRLINSHMEPNRAIWLKDWYGMISWMSDFEHTSDLRETMLETTKLPSFHTKRCGIEVRY